MAKIKTYLDNIKNAMFGRDVRDSIHNGIEAINEEVESTTIRQQDLESTFDELIINAGNSNAEIVDARVGANGTSYAKLGDRLNEVDSQIKDVENLKADKIETNENIKIIQSNSNFYKDKIISFTSINKEYYLEDGFIKCQDTAELVGSSILVDNLNELSFKCTDNSKWVVVGATSNFDIICVNIRGITTSRIMRMNVNGSSEQISDGIVREQCSIGDYIYVKHIGKIAKLYKNNKFWFEVDLSSYEYITNLKLGLYCSPIQSAFCLCEDYMGINSLKVPDIIPVEIKNETEWRNKTFVTLGDSITAQDGVVYGQGTEQGQIARGYQTVMKEKLGFSSYLNKGMSGRPIANGSINGVGTNTTSKTIDYNNFDLVIIAGGTNDFKLNISLGTKGIIGDTNFDTNTFYGAYRDMLEYILKSNPHIRICLFTPLQRDNAGYDVNYTNSVGHKLIDYVNAIREIGQMYSVPVCDMYSNSGFTKLTLNIYTIDGLHPNNIGYARMGDYASKFIDNIGL